MKWKYVVERTRIQHTTVIIEADTEEEGRDKLEAIVEADAAWEDKQSWSTGETEGSLELDGLDPAEGIVG